MSGPIWRRSQLSVLAPDGADGCSAAGIRLWATLDESTLTIGEWRARVYWFGGSDGFRGDLLVMSGTYEDCLAAAEAATAQALLDGPPKSEAVGP